MTNDQKLIDELLSLTEFLEEEYVIAGTEAYPPFLEGTARKSYYYLYSLKNLAGDEKNGDAVIDLSRSLLESLMVVMYVTEFGKEKKAKKFLIYSPIETWGDGQFALDANIELPPEAVEQRRKEYEEVKGDYLRPTKKEIAEKEAKRAIKAFEKIVGVMTDEQKQQLISTMTEGKSAEEIINKSWDGTDLETMMDELNKKGKFPGNLRQSIQRIYIYGNKKNHLSPNDINLLLDSAGRNQRNRGYHMNIGLYISLLSYIMIMIELAELRKEDELKSKLEAIKEKLLSSAEKEPLSKEISKT